ncbi:enhancer of polycomb homolog 1-like isoform X2 [Amphibalanus amphitrite]|uniref:enhancer of polycomb homolog 1-like isoform X2 n=1 Tax=Amphibalanus amphitrite TaxID=1232801 RepID=UPI001C918884|nr:enhancer of polycomb homolog 1-like isoform X2 [Amphibalanus amphitrite]
MSKLSFRARALDASKPMPIYLSEELPDLPEYLSINRAVPQMPSGMEKEEESERHLQEAISAGKVIPTPEVFGLEELGDGDRLNLLYPHNNKVPKQYIHYQSYAFDNDVPEYDLDSDDEMWINAQVKKMDVSLTYDQFEEMMDRLEKGSGQQVITLKEAKLLLKEDDDLIVAVYDYWLNKRLRLQYPLIPTVKTEKTVGAGHTNNPYIAFRRRVEKMQTRKNRKNDEASYEKMLKLRRDLSRAVTILEMVKRREKMKKEHLHLTVEIFEKRYSIGDFSGQVLTDVSAYKASSVSSGLAPPPPPPAQSVTSRPAFNSSIYLNQHQWATKVKIRTVQDDLPPKEKRAYKKRKHGRSHIIPSARPSTSGYLHVSDVVIDTVTSDEEEAAPLPSSLSAHLPAASAVSEGEDEDPDGEFTFRRKRNCSYLAPSLSERLEGRGAGQEPPPSVRGAAGKRHYRLGSLRRPRRHFLGLVRHRVGRGGRVIIDRTFANGDDYWRSLDFDVLTDSRGTESFSRRFCPVEEPPPSPVSELDVEDYIQHLPSGYQIEGTPLDASGSVSSSQPPGRPLSVHMVPSSSVRLVPTPELAADVCSPPASPTGDTLGLSSFSLAPSDTFSELVTNLISPYLVDSDGVLMDSAQNGADLDGAEEGSWTASEPPADSAGPAAGRTTGFSGAERCGRPEVNGGVWPTPVTSAPSGLVTLLGGSGGMTTTSAGSAVLLADTPPAMELMTDKADNGHLAGSEPHSRHSEPPVSASDVRKGCGPMEVT